MGEEKKHREISVPQSPRRIRFKALVAMICVLLIPMLGLVLGALLDHIEIGLATGNVLGLGLAFLISHDMEKDWKQSITMAFMGVVLAYICSTVVVTGEANWAVLLMGLTCGLGISLVIPELKKLGR